MASVKKNDHPEGSRHTVSDKIQWCWKHRLKLKSFLFILATFYSFNTGMAQDSDVDDNHNFRKNTPIAEPSLKNNENNAPFRNAQRILKEIVMLQGEVKSISLVGDKDIHVSRRGIIDIFQIADNEWNIVALRNGVVTINSDSGGSKQTFIIRVLPPSNLTQTSDGDSLPQWICSTTGAECDHEARIIKGTWHDSPRFNQARRWCLQNNCLFQAILSQLSQDKLKQHLQEILGQSFYVEILPSGLVTVHSDCQNNFPITQKIDVEQLQAQALSKSATYQQQHDISKIIGQEIHDDQLVVRCRNHTMTQTFRLETKILKISTSEMNALGFSTASWLRAKVPPFHLDAELTARLESAQRKHNFENVGQPALRLVVGRPAVLRSGGEFPVSTQSRKGFSSHTSWKSYGLILKASVLPMSSAQVRLIYHLEVKTREADHVSVHAVEGDLNLQLGKPVIGAALDMQASDREQVMQPLLANLPIVGPLFRVGYDSENASHLFAWFKISPDDLEELRDTKTDWPDPGKSR